MAKSKRKRAMERRNRAEARKITYIVLITIAVLLALLLLNYLSNS